MAKMTDSQLAWSAPMARSKIEQPRTASKPKAATKEQHVQRMACFGGWRESDRRDPCDRQAAPTGSARGGVGKRAGRATCMHGFCWNAGAGRTENDSPPPTDVAPPSAGPRSIP